MATSRAATDVQDSYLRYTNTQVTFNPSPDTDSVSCFIWVYWTDSSVAQIAFSGKSGSGTAVNFLYEFTNKTGSDLGSTTTSTSSLSTNKWSSWGMSFPGGTGTLKLYIDGVEDNSATRTGASRNGNLYIYCNNSEFNEINDVTAYAQYYEIELTEAHMQEIQYQPFAHAGSLSWMPDMLQNGTFRDLSKDQNGNPAVLIGGSVNGSSNGPPVFLLGGQ